MTTAMSDLQPGDTVTVSFDGEDHPGAVESVGRGWVTARIRQDPSRDYKGIFPPDKTLKTKTIDFTVCVRDTHIRKGDQ
jgi:hypothetical protein